MRCPFIFAAALALVAQPACTPSVPDAPTYKNDVQPIFMARCVRCHGAGDMLNAADPTIQIPVKVPQTCYLQRYEDEGDCSMVSTCRAGAARCASMLHSYIVEQPADSTLRMPPFPADQLSEWDVKLVLRWAMMTPPAP